MKKKALTAFISVLLFSAVAGTQFFSVGMANPGPTYYSNGGGISPQQVGAKAPVITILSPQINSVLSQDNVTLAFNVTVGSSSTPTYRVLRTVHYKVDWQQNDVYVYNSEGGSGDFATALNLTGINGTRIPEGKHNVTVYATEMGSWHVDTKPRPGLDCRVKGTSYTFFIQGSSIVFFTVDATSPSISFLSVENKTYGTSDVPLNFTVNESVSQVTYSLDGQENMTINGNTTLTGLPNGNHNVTVYAIDEAGNIGASETIHFTTRSFPTTLVITSFVSVVVIGIGLLVYFKKRKH